MPVVVMCSDEPGGLERVVAGLGVVLLRRSDVLVGRAVRDAVEAARGMVA